AKQRAKKDLAARAREKGLSRENFGGAKQNRPRCGDLLILYHTCGGHVARCGLRPPGREVPLGFAARAAAVLVVLYHRAAEKGTVFPAQGKRRKKGREPLCFPPFFLSVKVPYSPSSLWPHPQP